MTATRNGILLVLLFLFSGGATQASGVPPWLPRYDLEIRLDPDHHTVLTRQQVTWTNHHQRSATELIFNAHAHYKVPDKEVGYFAKTLELLRMNPGEALDTIGEALQVDRVTLVTPPGVGAPAQAGRVELPFQYAGSTATDLVISLPHPVGPGETITVILEHTFHLPQRMGRWGQWQGVTTLSNWLPVLAVYDDEGWHPTPFIPWHQPFFNEAGIYDALVTLPADQKLACTGAVTGERDLPDGLRQVSITAIGVRDFALLCSARYQEFTGQTEVGRGLPPVRVRVLAFPEHEHYAQEMVRIACEVIPVYSRWFGPYPYPDFTITEAFFGWNGNECSTLIMIDERVFSMPKLAGCYVEYLVAHETCHQWWYNLVGTNGYCETWMDEALATYCSHRFMNDKHGKNNDLLHFPSGLEWLPNIRRQDYRNYGLLGTIARGENGPVVQEIPKFGHLVNLFSLCYDKGARIVGMIEERLGEAAFLDFLRIVQHRYRYRILRVADFQRELEAYTGQSWDTFFRDWLHGPGLCDWCVEKVKITGAGKAKKDGESVCHATILLHQKGECTEQTVLGIALDKDDEYTLRIPITPQTGRVELPDVCAVVECEPDNRVRVEVVLPCKPKQITVDPDQILIDKEPANNFWKKPIRTRVTPLYTSLEETDLTNAYDRWNIICGPWINRQAYADPWYTKSTLAGVRAGVYRTQQFSGGVYAAYRTDYRDVVAGADGLLDHWPLPHTQLGFHVEERLVSFQDGRDTAFRGVVYARYVKQYGSSLYLPPMEYVEGFADYQDNFLPNNLHPVPGARRFDNLGTGGLHYHLNYLTPYWDPAGGFQLDLTYAGGTVELDDGPPALKERTQRAAHQVTGQFSMVKGFPDLTGLATASGPLGEWAGPALCWLADSRLAFRLYGAAGLPDEVEYFPLGGGSLFRGFDQRERQGSLVWVASAEWRLPLAREVHWDVCDHVFGARNLYGALFYDVGDAYTRGHSAGPVAHALGAGLRMDVAIFGFVERTTLRFDAAKTVNVDSPVQFWFGVQHPF
ncbi:MAG TPA: M1 family aminopeptidase [Gemmataceae bacterium]|nr:M1 family aminopeptidase [Gemmataceae bacterium]